MQLKIALRTRGKCVVVEGPSGIGKTTAIKKALESLNLKDVVYLSARKKSDEYKIKQIANGEFNGVQIIDDFHRLDSETKEKISDVMKYLADENIEDQKIVVIGINRVGDSLITFSPDLNDKDTRMLVAEDPKFIFYLKTINWNNFARDIGYLQLINERKYDYALSFAGNERQYAEKIFNRLTTLEISVFYDKNEQSNILSENVEEYLYPIYNSEAIYVVPLLSKNYPNRVWTKFESKAFKDRFGQHAVIPIWFKDTDTMFDESKNYGGLTFNPDGDVDQQIDDIVNSLAKKIEESKITS